MENINLFFVAVISSLGGAFASYIILAFKTVRAIKGAAKVILRREIREIHKAALNGQVDYGDIEDLEEIESFYKALGGNGTGEVLYKDTLNIYKEGLKDEGNS